MPKWKERKTGGSWPDERSEPICSQDQQNQLTTAFNNFISAGCINSFPGLEQRLREKWETIELSCDDDVCTSRKTGSWPNEQEFPADVGGLTSSNRDSILICPSRFANPNDLAVTLLHELVHVAGGWELDAEAVEWNCFSGNGAFVFPAWDRFKSQTKAFNGNEDERIGEWVIWNSTTGEVWGIVKAGGSWPGNGTITRGPLCFQHNDWIHNYAPPAGGWP